VKRVNVERPALFRAFGPVHVDRDGVPFYVFDHRDGATFTLPPGRYTLSGGVLVGAMPDRRGKVVARRPIYPLPRKLTIVKAPNPRTASVNIRTGVITADPSIFPPHAPEFVSRFVLLHELGHYFFREEHECDAFAASEMYRRGYNASQIHLAAKLSMKDGHRCKLNYQHALKYGGK
jgi:hypothetical protein